MLDCNPTSKLKSKIKNGLVSIVISILVLILLSMLMSLLLPWLIRLSRKPVLPGHPHGVAEVEELPHCCEGFLFAREAAQGDGDALGQFLAFA